MQRSLPWPGGDTEIPDFAVCLPPFDPDVAHALEEIIPQDILLSRAGWKNKVLGGQERSLRQGFTGWR